MMDKTLGQIAYEDSVRRNGDWSAIWANMPQAIQQEWETIAVAVAAAVKEEDARICEGMPIMFGKARLTSPDDCADAIRASIKEVK